MSKVLIIAEAGVNHNGSLQTAKKMAETAKECGADIIKFQTFKPEALVSKSAGKAEYQKRAVGNEETQLDMLRKLMLTEAEFKELAAYCKETGVEFLSTPFDLESIDFLTDFPMPFWKVPSGEVTNFPYLKRIGETGKRVIMSTGMCELEEITEAIDVLRTYGTSDIQLLHCNTEYPTPFEDVNLYAMRTLSEKFHVPVGYSDHTQGIEAPIAAAALGAVVIEKHFTLDREMEGPDHKASLEPCELRQMVKAVRHIEKALGSGEKKPSVSEQKNRAVVRKSIVAAKAIEKGELFTEENLTAKRPGNGISPMRWEEVMGQRAVRDFAEDELIEI